MAASMLCMTDDVVWLGQRSVSTLSICFRRAMDSTRFDKVKVVILGQGVTPRASQTDRPACIRTRMAMAGPLMAMCYEQAYHRR